jgi:methyltransferase family protein
MQITENLRVVVLHPKLFVFLPMGKGEVMKKHAAIEVEKARKLYSRGLDSSLVQIFDRYDTELCANYKGCFLYAMIRKAKPLVVIETGVASGVSSYSILQALEDNGKGSLYSIDLPNVSLPLPKGQNAGFLVPESLKSRWTLKLGDSKSELPILLDRVGSVDFFIHDSLHEYGHMMFEYEAAWPKLRKGGILFSDDVSFTDAFQDFCKSRGLQGTIVERRESGYTIKLGWVEKP